MDTTLKHIQDFATKFHDGQLRKYTGEDYVTHVIEVARLVKENDGTFEMQAAALMHDLLEDTDLIANEISTFLLELTKKPNVFMTVEQADDIVELVIELTDTYTHEAYPGLNRKTRKAMEANRLSKASTEAKFIKFYDMVDNTKSIVEHDPKFAEVYLVEKQHLLDVMFPDNLHKL